MAHNWKEHRDGTLRAEPYCARWYELIIEPCANVPGKYDMYAITDEGSDDLGRFDHLADAKEHAAVVEGQVTV